MKLTLTAKKEEVSNVVSFTFQSKEALLWKAGQFMRYHIEDPRSDERATDRYFTIASAPFEKNLILTTRFDPEDGSTFKKDLKNMQVGSVIEAQPPSGEFVVDDPDQEYVFIAGGIGITPFRSILLQLDYEKKPINIILLYANRDNNIVYRDELEEISTKNPAFKISYIIDPQRIDEATIKQFVPDLIKPVFYVSGPKPMVQAMEKMLVDMGIPENHIKHDYFPGYQSI